MFKLTLIKNTNIYDITPITGKFEWESNLTITVAMEFEIAKSDTFDFPKNPCDIGDLIVLTKDKTEIFRGIIVEEQKNGRQAIKYLAYDYSWYLNKSTSVYQFNNISATQAITRVLNDFGIQIGSMLSMPTKIDQIYMLKTPGQIIQDIIEKVESQEGYKVNAEMRQGNIYFERRKDLLITGRFQLASNIGFRDVVSTISEPSRTRSIEPMRNRIRLIVEDEETEYEVTAEKEDAALIQRYGLLEETIKLDAEDSAKSRQIARILLARLAKIHETNSALFMGDIRFKAGRLFDVVEPVTGMTNRFMIIEAKHKVNRQIHTMNLDLALPEDVG